MSRLQLDVRHFQPEAGGLRRFLEKHTQPLLCPHSSVQHCRHCGHTFCSSCCKYSEVFDGFAAPQKVCNTCHSQGASRMTSICYRPLLSPWWMYLAQPCLPDPSSQWLSHSSSRSSRRRMRGHSTGALPAEQQSCLQQWQQRPLCACPPRALWSQGAAAQAQATAAALRKLCPATPRQKGPPRAAERML